MFAFIFQQDNVAIYIKKWTRQWFEEHNIEVHNWPERSPDLNAQLSNAEKLQKQQFRLLRITTGAPWYIRNIKIHDMKVALVRE